MQPDLLSVLAKYLKNEKAVALQNLIEETTRTGKSIVYKYSSFSIESNLITRSDDDSMFG